MSLRLNSRLERLEGRPGDGYDAAESAAEFLRILSVAADEGFPGDWPELLWRSARSWFQAPRPGYRPSPREDEPPEDIWAKLRPLLEEWATGQRWEGMERPDAAGRLPDRNGRATPEGPVRSATPAAIVMGFDTALLGTGTFDLARADWVRRYAIGYEIPGACVLPMEKLWPMVRARMAAEGEAGVRLLEPAHPESLTRGTYRAWADDPTAAPPSPAGVYRAA